MKRRIIEAILVNVLALTLIVAACVFLPKILSATDISIDNLPPPKVSPADDTPERKEEKSAAFALVEEMGVGWNLGNALDSIDNQKNGIINGYLAVTPEEYYETLWGNPVTTAKTIADIAEMGFGAVRIPVTWQDHMDEELKITPTWLERVKQVVDYVLDNDMYCIINLHHDTGSGTWPWLKADPANLEQITENLRTVWRQIAMYFIDYSDKLLFESFNEILDMNDRWTDSTAQCYEAVNVLNQAFVDTVRATGGLNVRRFLIVNPYAASVDNDVLLHYRLPVDTVKDRLIASVHTYAPAGFTWNEDMASWTETYSTWDEERGGREIRLMLQSVRTNLVEKGIPVIIGECGAWNKNNAEERGEYAAYLVREAAKDHITCFWWDGGGTASAPEEVVGATLYDRYNEVWLFPEVAEALVRAAEEAWA